MIENISPLYPMIEYIHPSNDWIYSRIQWLNIFTHPMIEYIHPSNDWIYSPPSQWFEFFSLIQILKIFPPIPTDWKYFPLYPLIEFISPYTHWFKIVPPLEWFEIFPPRNSVRKFLVPVNSSQSKIYIENLKIMKIIVLKLVLEVFKLFSYNFSP